MGKINVECKNIENLEVKPKVVDELEKGEVVGHRLVSTIKFDVEGHPGKLSEVLFTMAHGDIVNVNFSSPQLVLEDVIDGAGKKSKLNKDTGELMPTS